MSLAVPDKRERQSEHAPYPEAEIEFVRQRLRLPPDEPIGPWVEYCRAWSDWRERCNCLLTWILTNPSAYVRAMSALYRRRHGAEPAPGWVAQHTAAVDSLAGQLMAYARPGQGSLSLALEILGQQDQPRCVSLIREMIAGRWLPKEPRCPSETKRERDQAERARRSGISEERRQANAEALVAGFAP